MDEREPWRAIDPRADAEITVELGSKTLASARDANWLDDGLRGQLAAANVILMPWDGFREWDRPVFPEHTEELYRFIRDRAPESIVVDMALSDQDYVEVSLRSDTVTIPALIVSTLVAPVVVELVAEWLKRRLLKRHDDAVVRCNISIDNGDGSARSLEYEGPAATFEKMMLGNLQRLPDSDDE